VPLLLTKEEYKRRGVVMSDAQVKFDSQRLSKQDLEFAEFDARNVHGVSQLCRLPYFDIVDQSLYDMMHLVSGIVGRNCMQLTKGTRRTGNNRPQGDKPPDPGARPPLPEAWDKIYNPSHADKKMRASIMKKYDEWSEAGEKLRKWYAEQRLRTFEKRFGSLNKKRTDEIDEVYTRVQAPLNIAPKAKHPYRLSSEMTAYHWVNFTKVYGKYLFHTIYRDERDKYPFRIDDSRSNYTLDGLCQLMDVLTSCLASNATAATKVRTDELVKKFATHFDEMLPITEQVVNMHNLIFHIPSMIKRWGPARGFWCFPFER
jgi:hypothetical protein